LSFKIESAQKHSELVMASDQGIRFRFDARKAAQAANKLLLLSGGCRNYMELIKLLYLVTALRC
jgi:hypothetical protein